MQGLFSMFCNAVLLPCCEISCSYTEVHKVLWLSQLICTEQLAFDSAASMPEPQWPLSHPLHVAGPDPSCPQDVMALLQEQDGQVRHVALVNTPQRLPHSGTSPKVMPAPSKTPSPAYHIAGPRKPWSAAEAWWCRTGPAGSPGHMRGAAAHMQHLTWMHSLACMVPPCPIPRAAPHLIPWHLQVPDA